MSKEPILLSQDNELLNRIVGDLSKFKKTFEFVKASFEQLQMGNLSSDIYSFIATGKTNPVRGCFFGSVERQLEESGITNMVLRTIAMQGTEETFNEFNTAAQAFVNTDLTPSPYGVDKDRQHFLHLDDITYTNEGLSITDQQREAILERCCRLYASTDLEKEIYFTTKELAPALRKYLTALKEAGIPFYQLEFNDGRKGYSPQSYIENFFTCDLDMTIKTIPDMITWAAGYKKAEAARNQRGY